MPDRRLDPMTIAALAVVVWCVTNQIHEGFGHGGACLVVGGHPRMLDAMFFDCDEDALGDGAIRFVAAAGAFANLLTAGVIAATERWWKNARSDLRYMIWLFAATNLLTGFGYLCFSGVGGVGDWFVVIDGLPGVGLLRIVEVGVGAALYFWVAPAWLLPRLQPWLGSGNDRVARARVVTVLPYVVGGLAQVVGGLLNPHGAELVMMSAVAASFGGNSLLAWYFTVRAKETDPSAGEGLGIERRWGWVAAAAVVLVVFALVLGPGIAFG